MTQNEAEDLVGDLGLVAGAFERRILGTLLRHEVEKAVAAERERCAAVADEQAARSARDAKAGYPDEAHLVAEMIAERIREGKS